MSMTWECFFDILSWFRWRLEKAKAMRICQLLPFTKGNLLTMKITLMETEEVVRVNVKAEIWQIFGHGPILWDNYYCHRTILHMRQDSLKSRARDSVCWSVGPSVRRSVHSSVYPAWYHLHIIRPHTNYKEAYCKQTSLSASRSVLWPTMT